MIYKEVRAETEPWTAKFTKPLGNIEHLLFSRNMQGGRAKVTNTVFALQRDCHVVGKVC